MFQEFDRVMETGMRPDQGGEFSRFGFDLRIGEGFVLIFFPS